MAWWPDPQGLGFWPESVPRTESLEAFYRAFEAIGYSACDAETLEAGFEKDRSVCA